MFKCGKCGTPYTLNDTVCAKCGHVLFDPERSTIALQIDPNVLWLRRTHPLNGALYPEKSVSLVVVGMVERFIFEQGTEIILGRTDSLTADPGHFDLTRYCGQARGISRTHALMRFTEETITITDLGSSNGTFVNTQRLEPHQPHPLHAEDKLMLGSLSMLIRFH
jgi:hypothetical protein